MDYLAALRETFVKGIPDRLHIIEERWHARDQLGVAHEVHKLRGAAGGFGFQALSDAAARLEDALQSDASLDGSELHALLGSLRTAAGFNSPSSL